MVVRLLQCGIAIVKSTTTLSRRTRTARAATWDCNGNLERAQLGLEIHPHVVVSVALFEVSDSHKADNTYLAGMDLGSWTGVRSPRARENDLE